MGGVEEGLGRNAAPVKAAATQARIALDETNLLSQVSRVKRGGVTAGAGTNDNNSGFNGIHKLRSFAHPLPRSLPHTLFQHVEAVFHSVFVTAAVGFIKSVN